MVAKHSPPAGLTDFDHGASPADLYSKWDIWMSGQMSADQDFPAWYDNVSPPNVAAPAGDAPPWSGLPRTALILHGNDVLSAAAAVDMPVDFGSGEDALLVAQPPFLGLAQRSRRVDKIAGRLPRSVSTGGRPGRTRSSPSVAPQHRPQAQALRQARLRAENHQSVSPLPG